MTHDELLEKIQQRHWQLFNFHSVDQSNEASEFRKAVQENTNILRAVIELHKKISWHSGCPQCGYYEYPCPTIKAIESHLQ